MSTMDRSERSVQLTEAITLAIAAQAAAVAADRVFRMARGTVKGPLGAIAASGLEREAIRRRHEEARAVDRLYQIVRDA